MGVFATADGHGDLQHLFRAPREDAVGRCTLSRIRLLRAAALAIVLAGRNRVRQQPGGKPAFDHEGLFPAPDHSHRRSAGGYGGFRHCLPALAGHAGVLRYLSACQTAIVSSVYSIRDGDSTGDRHLVVSAEREVSRRSLPHPVPDAALAVCHPRGLPQQPGSRALAAFSGIEPYGWGGGGFSLGAFGHAERSGAASRW